MMKQCPFLAMADRVGFDFRHFLQVAGKLDIAIIVCVYAAFKHVFNFGPVACGRPPLTMKTVLP